MGWKSLEHRRQWAAANRERLREQGRVHDKKRRENGKALTLKQKWRKDNPIKHRAHMVVSYAVRIGKLKKQPCEICGTMEKLQAHHDDHTKPLEVRWVCQSCHLLEIHMWG